MFDAVRKWAGTIAVSPLVTSPDDAAAAAPGAVVLPDATIRQIKAEQVELLYEMDRGSGLRPVIAFIITTWVIAGFNSVMPWAALALYCAAWTGYHSLQLTFLKTEWRHKNPEYWARQFTLASLCTGLSWGLGSAVWFKADDVGNQAIVTLVIMGVGASSIISRALHRPAMIAFMVPAALPIIASLLVTGTQIAFVMMAFGVLFLTGLLQWGKSLNKWQLDSFALRFQNEALVDSLDEQRRVAEKAKEAAEAGSRAKSEFLATMSHEVRTPLNGILGMARLLQTSELDHDQKEQLDVIVESGEMLSTVLNDILDLSKLEAGRLEMEHQPFKAQSPVESVTRLLSGGARQKGLDLEICADTSHEIFARGDVFRVRQILLNLIGNAIKFTDSGEITITIAPTNSDLVPPEIAASVPPEAIVFAIRDTGVGIAPKVVPNLFQPFRQADQSTTRKYGGSGLGLAICKRLVDMMEGKIGVASQPGRGSTFWFALPKATASEAAGLNPAQTVEAPHPTESRRILLVEDNDLNAKVAFTLLQRAGHTVERAHDGVEAVDYVRERLHKEDGLPDLILMDVRMPRLSGPEAAQSIRKLGEAASRLPILALTADITATDYRNDRAFAVPEEYEGTFDGVLTKPIIPAELNKVIAAQTGQGINLAVLRSDDARLDVAHLSGLLSSLGSKTFEELIETFQADVATLAADLEKAADDHNEAEVQIRAHDLAGAAANLGFVALADAARRLKSAVATQDEDALEKELQGARSAFHEANEILNQFKHG